MIMFNRIQDNDNCHPSATIHLHLRFTVPLLFTSPCFEPMPPACESDALSIEPRCTSIPRLNFRDINRIWLTSRFLRCFVCLVNGGLSLTNFAHYEMSVT